MMRTVSRVTLAAALCVLGAGLAADVDAAVGGGRAGGGAGFTRGGAAAGGGFAGGGRASQLPATPQRDLGGARDSASQIQSTRGSSSTNVTINNNGGCSGSNCNWDNGRAAAAVIGGAIAAGSVVAAQNAGANAAAAAQIPPASGTLAPPCNVPPVDVSGVPYYKCGVTWYTAGYASNGVVYMPVGAPPGH